MKMLAFGSEACDDSEGRCLGSSISMRSTAECRGARLFHFFHLSPGCIRGVGLVCVGLGGCFVCFFCFVWIAPGFFARHLPGANRASSSLNHRRFG